VGTLYQTQLEFAYMILKYHFYSGNDISAWLPFIESSVVFYDKHYQFRNTQKTGRPLNDDGKLVFHPTTAGEAHRGGTDPADGVAGMRAVLQAALRLPEDVLTEKQRGYFSKVLERTPELLVTSETVNGEEMGFLMESRYDTRWLSSAVPVLYSVFPFDLVHPGTREFEYAVNTWNHKLDDDRRYNYQSWRPGAFQSARLGMTETAERLTVRKLSNSPRRFPTFWGPGHDWVPDHNWGGSGMIALQEMLMQTYDGKIHLFPAWPAGWDVEFKLHAPGQTVVQGKRIDGQLVDLKVTPESRRKDVVEH